MLMKSINKNNYTTSWGSLKKEQKELPVPTVMKTVEAEPVTTTETEAVAE